MARTRPAEVGDASASDFSAGSAGADVHIGRGTESGVLLAPAVAADFTGPDLPKGWFVETLDQNGVAVPAAPSFAPGPVSPALTGRSGPVSPALTGRSGPVSPALTGRSGPGLALDRARAGTTKLFQAGRTLEFEATFSRRPHQHIGLGHDFAAVPWIMFSTKFGKSLYVRTRFHRPVETRLSADWLDTPHRFRIDWNVLDVVFSIDGERVAHQLVPIVGFLRPLASSIRAGGILTLHWLRLTPYRPKGTFVSRALDAGAPVRWGAPTWDADVPAGTKLSLQVRTADTPDPRPRWSRWAALRPDVPVETTSRYLQYRARLATTDPDRTPVLRRVGFRYGPPV